MHGCIMLQGGVKELAKITEEAMAVLRGELQTACFHFMHKLSHIKFTGNLGSAPSSSSGGAVRSSAAVAGISAASSSATSKSYSNFGGSNAGAVSGGAQKNWENSSYSALPEEELILSAFNKHVHSFYAAVSVALVPAAVAVVFSPLCALVPRLIMKCVMHLLSGWLVANNLLQHSGDDLILTYGTNPALARTGSLVNGLPSEQKTRLLRMLITAQQNVSILIQSSGL
jgi:hypothetical protein